MFLAVALGATRAGAQDSPDRPLTVADGRVTVGGDVTLTAGTDDPGYFNFTDYGRSALRLVLFDAGDEVVVTAGSEGIRFLLVSGQPLQEPVAWRGPIVMNTQQELQQAFAELQRGTFIKNGRHRPAEAAPTAHPDRARLKRCVTTGALVADRSQPSPAHAMPAKSPIGGVRDRGSVRSRRRGRC